MKELILVRHAKSDWGNEVLKDIDRCLNERGYDDAYSMSKWYKTEKQAPQLIVSSYATRTLSTAFIFARELSLSVEKIMITEKFYEAKADKILKYIASFDKKVDSVMLFMHNPGITELTNLLNDEVFMDNVPTCGIVSVQLAIADWSEISGVKGKLNYFKFPKDFKAS